MISLIYFCFLAFLAFIAWVNWRTGLIPNRLTLSGATAGIVASVLFPSLQGRDAPIEGALMASLGAIIAFVAGWTVVCAGKYFFGVKRILFSDALPFELIIEPQNVLLNVGDEQMSWSEIFSRTSDRLVIEGSDIVCIPEIPNASKSEVVFSFDGLWIDDQKTELASLWSVTGYASQVDIPREALGFGAVKLFLLMGAFLGPIDVLHCLGLTAAVIMLVGLFGYLRSLLSSTFESSSRIEVAPCSAVASTIFIVWKIGAFHLL